MNPSGLGLFVLLYFKKRFNTASMLLLVTGMFKFLFNLGLILEGHTCLKSHQFLLVFSNLVE